MAAGLLGGLLGGTALAQAQERQEASPSIDALRREVEDLKRDYTARLEALEQKLNALQAAGPVAAPPVVPSPQAAPTLPAENAAALPAYGAAGSKVFNPDISAIGDFLGVAGRSPGSGEPSLQLHEAELGFQAAVDPYARADFFLTYGAEEVGIEEAYVTFPALPGGLLMKAGKMRDAFGKVDAMHTHTRPWADLPLVSRNLTGGEDALADAGISLSRLVPNPWLFLEATGQVYRGESSVFQAPTRGDLAYLGHLRAYRDLGESSNLDLGGSVAYGHNGSDPNATTRLFGADATFRYKPLRRAIYTHVLARGEAVWSRRQQPGGAQDAFGAYGYLEYQFARRFTAGARFDYSERAEDASLSDRGGSLLLTFWPSEFSQIRGQYRHTRFALGRSADEFLFQLQFSIGAHGAHEF